MHLKSLRAEGFKSFADKTELNFEGGITAIVGPNGSGKSNISDAIRWVLGEQSAKSLRGSKMEDVIFGGTQKRSKMGFAEVALTLDNSDKIFNSKFDEITVSRKVYASGESQYTINGASCRLKDIHEVFMDTGVGRDGYSMIGQGKIDEILSNKSEDRRIIFDEAAGISKYRYKKEEAERKLAHTEDNILRVSDIISELETQLAPLESQSKKAKKYLEYKEELKIYEVNAAVNTVENNKVALVKINEDIGVLTKHLSDIKSKLSDYDEEQEKVYAIFSECDEKIAEYEQQLRNIEKNNGILKSEADVMKNTVQSNAALSERIGAEIVSLNEKIAELKGGQVLLEEEKQRIKQKCEDIDEELKELTRKRDEDITISEDKSGAVEAIQNEIVAIVNSVSSLKIKLSGSSYEAEMIEKRLQETQTDIDAKEKELSEAEDRLKNLKSERDTLFAEIEEKEKDYLKLYNKNNEKSEKLDVLKRNFDEMSVELAQKKTRLKMLREMEENFTGYPKSVRFVMKAYADGEITNAKIYGPVSKLISVEDKYTVAIEVALGGAIQNIVVENENDAKAAIEYLKRSKTGRATFMPISAVRARKTDVLKAQNEKGYIGIAANLVKTEQKYSEIIQNLLGACVVIDNIDNAIAISKKYKNTFKIVTLQGEVLNQGGTMSGGYIGANSNILGRENEMNELKKAVREAEEMAEKTKTELDELSLYISDSKSALGDLYDELSENKQQLAASERDIEHNNIVLRNYNSIIESMKAGLSELDIELCQKKEDAKKIEDEMLIQENKITEKRKILEEKEQEIEEFLYKKEQLSDEIVKKTMERAELLKDITVADEKKETAQIDISQAQSSIELRKTEIKDIEEKNKQLSDEIVKKYESIENERKQSEEIAENIKECKDLKKQHEEMSKNVQSESKELRDKIYALTSECGRLEARKDKLESETDAAVEKLWDEYEITYSETEKYKKDLGSHSVVNKTISELRNKIRGLGNINVDAIEEYKSVSERYEFLTSQRSDLRKAKNDLNAIIEEMLEVMKSRFTEEFEKISKYFKMTFTELFGGGRAELSLENPEDVLNSAINIDVQPPGKKLQSLLLLSGGERALSAIALLFAIMKIRPAPFCLLDEIEAALDESNVYRFGDYIKNYSKNTQFILITHRRGTMECADTIYGITMQEKGVSKLLKLDIGTITS